MCTPITRMEAVSAALRAGNYSAAIKELSSLLAESEPASLVQEAILCNRAFCYQQLELHRKALQA